MSDTSKADSYAALKIKDFKWFIIARFLLTFGIQMQSVIIGWHIYEITRDPLSLGLIGIAEAVPFFCVALFAGHLADIINRKKLILVSNVVYVLCAVALLLVSTALEHTLSIFGTMPIYSIIFVTGFARGFMFPSQTALIAQLVPREKLGNALTWNSASWQVAEMVGPAAGGLLCGFYGVAPVYFLTAALASAAFVFFFLIKDRPIPRKTKDETIAESLSAGVKFVFGNQIVLSAISLDMFAVFFGGAVAVLPVFADEILHAGPKGLGFLRAAPVIGALFMSIAQTRWPLFKNAGKNLLIAVAGFGTSIILFALSNNFYLSLFLLMMSGMFDSISV
ncbi:MAG TPA: MFS transporter, partial [Ignavibacteriales bacterium]|nr:MFS transporter [Ignavibacteriales bacterium]